jgi:hypothetical protein
MQMFNGTSWVPDPNSTGGTTGTASLTGATASASNTAIENAVAGITSLKGTAAEDLANSQASATSAAGYAAEANAYGTAAGIATENAGTAGIIGGIKNYQQQYELTASIGSTKAGAAAAGFTGGSSADILRSSYQQGALASQLITTQTALTQGGYQEEAAAATAQATAATATETAAQILSQQQAAAGQTATANAASELTALQTYLNTYGGTTPEAQLALSTLGVSGAVNPVTGAASAGTTPATTTTATGAPGGAGGSIDPGTGLAVGTPVVWKPNAQGQLVDQAGVPFMTRL